MPDFDRVAILGVGLIGASFAMAMRKAGLCRHIVGYGRTETNLIKAKDRGIIDTYELDLSQAVKDADLIVLATPPGTFTALAEKIRPSLKSGAIVIDVGSVKGRLVYEMEALMPPGVHFVGCHPIAGNNRSGIDSASPDLFVGAPCIITATPKTADPAIQKVSALWKAMSAVVKTMGPDLHDEIYAVVSHLPHLIAYALVNTVADIDESYLSLSGPGFRDTTRIAGSPPELWRDIVMLNKDNLLKFIAVFRANIDRLSGYLRAEDAGSIEREFKRAQKLRETLKRDIGKD